MFKTNQTMPIGELAFAFKSTEVQLPIIEFNVTGMPMQTAKTVFVKMSVKNKLLNMVITHSDIADTDNVMFDVICAPTFQPGIHGILGLALTDSTPLFIDLSKKATEQPASAVEETTELVNLDDIHDAFTGEFISELESTVLQLKKKNKKLKKRNANLEEINKNLADCNDDLLMKLSRLSVDSTIEELGAVPGGASEENFTNSSAQFNMLNSLLFAVTQRVVYTKQLPVLSFARIVKELVETYRQNGLVMTEGEAYLLDQAIRCFWTHTNNLQPQTPSPGFGVGGCQWPQQPQRFTLGGDLEADLRPQHHVVEFGFGFKKPKQQF